MITNTNSILRLAARISICQSQAVHRTQITYERKPTFKARRVPPISFSSVIL